MALVDYFLKLDGIDGESQAKGHEKELELESWSWGETNSTSGHGTGGMGAGKVSMQDIHFVTKVSAASSKLMLACASGEHVKKAVLTCRKAGKDQQEFMKVTLSDVLVSSYQTGGSAHGDVVPLDQVSLAFAKVEFEYKPQKPDGTLGSAVKAGWDLPKNAKV
ncbi:MAG TPA: type VI secretion system tube protein Hcp [Pirellulales bacterium]|jgi:type VI secretion system secreted protein Hcp|nr:type VI secretion system tube protein Hcp [Pirellulales bacterium]